MNKDIYELLERWGAWAASDNSGVDWKPNAAGFKGLIPYSTKSRPQTTDDEGIFIDRRIAKLGQRRPEEYKIIIAHFVLGISLRRIAKKSNYSDDTIRKKMQSALSFLDALIYLN